MMSDDGTPAFPYTYNQSRFSRTRIALLISGLLLIIITLKPFYDSPDLYDISPERELSSQRIKSLFKKCLRSPIPRSAIPLFWSARCLSFGYGSRAFPTAIILPECVDLTVPASRGRIGILAVLK
jgi:hypothetical protein